MDQQNNTPTLPETQITPEDQWQEGQHLKQVYGKIKKAIDTLTVDNPKYREEIVEARRRMWEEETHIIRDGLDEAANSRVWIEAIAQNERTYEQNARQLRRLLRLEESAYFGRMDWVENGLPQETLYIGVMTFMDTDHFAPLIYDWRAPVSGIFYDYELGTAQYTCPEGQITGEVLLKRQYKISHEKLLYMFDCSVQIEDELLQEMLARKTSTTMRNIVTTIQREQNAIIRDDTHRVLLVLGAAGSGKTSIALHRAAWFLYRYQDRKYTSKNILILSPNEVFSDYIAQVLPELGEDAVRQLTIHTLVSRLVGCKVESPQQQLEGLWSSRNNAGYEDRRAVLGWKASSECLAALDAHVEKLQTRWTQRFAKIQHPVTGECLFTKEEMVSMFDSEFVAMPPASRLTRIRQILHYQLRPLRQKRFVELCSDLNPKNGAYKEQRALAWWQTFAEFKPIRDVIVAMTEYDPLQTYLDFYENGDFGLDKARHDMVQMMTLPSLRNAERKSSLLRWEDAPLLAWLRVKLEGNAQSKQLVFRTEDIFQLIVDEGQDYSAVQLALLQSLFPRVGMTILGDLRQTIAPRDVSVLREFASDGLVLHLNHCYRSSQPIVAFTKAMLPPGDGDDIVAVRREDVLPKLGVWRDMEMLWSCINDLLEEGWEAIGVICQTGIRSEEIYRQLLPFAESEREIINLLDEDARLSSGVTVLPLYLAKGLEFDAVVVLDADAEHYAREEDRLPLYTACTRALHRLTVLWGKDKQASRFLKGIPEELYRKV